MTHPSKFRFLTSTCCPLYLTPSASPLQSLPTFAANTPPLASIPFAPPPSTNKTWRGDCFPNCPIPPRAIPAVPADAAPDKAHPLLRAAHRSNSRESILQPRSHASPLAQVPSAPACPACPA